MTKLKTWRIFYRTDSDAVVILEILQKKTAATPKTTIELCIERLKRYDHESK